MTLREANDQRLCATLLCGEGGGDKRIAECNGGYGLSYAFHTSSFTLLLKDSTRFVVVRHPQREIINSKAAKLVAFINLPLNIPCRLQWNQT